MDTPKPVNWGRDLRLVGASLCRRDAERGRSSQPSASCNATMPHQLHSLLAEPPTPAVQAHVSGFPFPSDP